MPFNTTHAVFASILKSSHRLQLSIYSRSSLHQSSKLLISLRPFTCQRHVIPGLQLIFLRCQNSNLLISCLDGGLGPTRLISPFKTLHNCSSSSRLYFRNHPEWGACILAFHGEENRELSPLFNKSTANSFQKFNKQRFLDTITMLNKAQR